ncbi:MAG: glycosyltransferase [Methanotrichaceae archaeon]|nr:glycosyltransferase [Methanotrichaceae archaeon]
MNILFLSTRSPYPLISGHSLRTYHILKGAAQNHNIILVTFVQLPEHELKKENLDHLRSFCKAVYPFEIPADMSRTKLATMLFLNLFSSLPFVAQKYDAPLMRQRIRGIIQEGHIDLVHVDMLPLAAYISEFENLPKILVNHNVESVRLYRWFRTEPNPVKKVFLGIQWLKLKTFEQSAMNKFDGCVVVSELDRELLIKMGVKSRLFVVPNGTNTKFFKPNNNKVIENSVLWIGHMDVHTNKDAVLYFWKDIYPILKKRYPQVKMTFVGTAPPKEIADAAPQDPLLKATGFVDDIRPYIDEAAVMVVPIRIGSGTRLKILDAMAMGKAIVSTSVGCEGLNVNDGKDILIADSPEDFAGKTIELLKNADKRVNLERNAIELAKSYDWDLIGEKQEAAYEDVMRRKGL